MMQSCSAVIACPIEACWHAFTTPSRWVHWVTGLRGARVVAKTRDGLPREVYFEYAAGVSYVLRYSYDLDAREVRWEPRSADQGGVRGHARFEEVPQGTRMIYALAHDGTRTSLESKLDDARAFVDAFAASMADP